MDFLDDLLSEPSVAKAPVVSRFQPKLKARPKKAPSTAAQEQPVISVPPTSPSVQQIDSVEESDDKPAEVSAFPDVSFASSSPFRRCGLQSDDHTIPGDFQIDVERLEAGDFSCLDSEEMISEGTGALGKKAVKLRPKPKVQSDRKKDLLQSVSHLSDAPQPPENQYVAEDGPVHAEEPDTVSDPLHARLDGSFLFDPTTDEPHSVVDRDTDSLKSPDVAEQASGRGNYIQEQTSDASTSFDNVPDGGPVQSCNEATQNDYDFLDEIYDSIHGNSSLPTKPPDESTSNRDEINDVDQVVDEVSQRKSGRRSKKAASENEQPARKRVKPSQELDHSTEKPAKKFPRGTRRKRCVNKSLLEAPEDELDLQRVPIRDLLILADYKERQAKRGAAVVQPPSTNERTDDTQLEDQPYDDENGFGSDQDRDSVDNPSTSGIQKDTGCYNYQTYMTKVSRVKWTKQKTELFYQGIRQFGTDFGMIKQLFPELDRDHIKLKYKKEERQNPMMLQDALCSRPTGYTHFELVMQRLQEKAAREEEQREASGEDDSIDQMGEEGGREENLGTHAASQEAGAKSEQNAEGEAASKEHDKPQVGSSAYESDDDWLNSYVS